MQQSPDVQAEPEFRLAPAWVRAVVWVAISFLTASVILGMFLY